MSDDLSSSPSLSLVRALKADASTAWPRLFHLYGPLARSLCRQRGLQDADTEDVLQRVWIKVRQNIATFVPQRHGSFFVWFRALVRTTLLDFLRQRGRHPVAIESLEQIPAPEVPADADAALLTDAVRRALDLVRREFEPETWEAFWLTVVDELSPEQVGERLGKTRVAVRIARSRVLKRLREELGDA